MKIRIFLLLVFAIISNAVIAQQSLNEYKYIIVPKKYDFLNYGDQYQLNSLTKFLFKKEGFETLLDDEIKPQNLANNPCLSLLSKVEKDRGMFITKLVIKLVNCKNEIVFTSITGTNKEKDFKKSYHGALREAFQSITSLNYKYSPLKKIAVPVEKEQTVTVEKSVAPVKVETIVNEEESVSEKNKTIEVEQKVTDPNLLYAQTNTLGFQLVDSTPKVAYTLLKSSKQDIYFLKNKKGILYKENDKWIVEYYKDDMLVQKALTIKF